MFKIVVMNPAYSAPIIGWKQGKKVRSLICPYNPINEIATQGGKSLTVVYEKGVTQVTNLWSIQELDYDAVPTNNPRWK